MKKKVHIFTFSILLLCLGNIVFGQEISRDRIDLSDLHSKQYDLLEKQPYRITIINETFEDEGSKLKEKEIRIYESQSFGRYYYSKTTESNGKKSRYELIRINNKKIFTRENNGNWEKDVSESSGDFGTGWIEDITVKFIGTEMIGNKETRVYEKNETSYFPLSRGITQETEKYWFDENDYLLKATYEGKSLTKDLTYKSTTTYDYEAKINIKEPKIKNKSKNK